MEKHILRFKKSRKNNCMVAYKLAWLDKSEGHFAFLANDDVPVKQNTWYECEVVPMVSKRGFIVIKAVELK